MNAPDGGQQLEGARELVQSSFRCGKDVGCADSSPGRPSVQDGVRARLYRFHQAVRGQAMLGIRGLAQSPESHRRQVARTDTLQGEGEGQVQGSTLAHIYG